MCLTSLLGVANCMYSISGQRSAPLGQVIVPVSSLTNTLRKKLGSVRVVRNLLWSKYCGTFRGNGENKPAPKGREAHFYSTVYVA